MNTAINYNKIKKALYTISVFIICINPNNIIAQDIVQYKISKPLCLLNFVETIVGNENFITSESFQKYIEQNMTNDSSFKKSLAELNKINESFIFEQKMTIEYRFSNSYSYDSLCAAASVSNDLNEFYNNSKNILSELNHQKLFNILVNAEPYYDKLIWNKYEKALIKKVNNLKKFQPQVNNIFNKLKLFYNSNWQIQKPFIVCFYPELGEFPSHKASVNNNLIVSAIPIEWDEPALDLSVVVHEICHALYESQALEFKLLLEKLFLNSKSEYKKIAYLYFDEALATACGQGWAYKQIKDKKNSENWYYDEYVDDYSHIIYDLTEGYINKGMEIDSSYIANCIEYFKNKFKKSIYKFDLIFKKINIYTEDSIGIEEEDKLLVIPYSFNSLEVYLFYTNIDSINSFNESNIIFVSQNVNEVLLKLCKIFPEHEKYLKDNTDKNFVLSFFDNKNRPTIIIITDDIDKLEIIIKNIFKKKYIDIKNPYLKLNI